MSLGTAQRAAAIGFSLVLAAGVRPSAAPNRTSDDDERAQGFRRLLVISIDGMHAVDFANCSKGIDGVNHGQPYCPAMAELAEHGVNHLSASTSKPSDSLSPVQTAIIEICGCLTGTATVASNERGAPYLRSIPLYIVAGNHDVGDSGATANLLADSGATVPGASS